MVGLRGWRRGRGSVKKLPVPCFLAWTVGRSTRRSCTEGASRPAVSRFAARQEHEERTGGKRHHGEPRNRVVGAAIKASALTVKRPTCGALGGH